MAGGELSPVGEVSVGVHVVGLAGQGAASSDALYVIAWLGVYVW